MLQDGCADASMGARGHVFPLQRGEQNAPSKPVSCSEAFHSVRITTRLCESSCTVAPTPTIVHADGAAGQQQHPTIVPEWKPRLGCILQGTGCRNCRCQDLGLVLVLDLVHRIYHCTCDQALLSIDGIIISRFPIAVVSVSWPQAAQAWARSLLEVKLEVENFDGQCRGEGGATCFANNGQLRASIDSQVNGKS